MLVQQKGMDLESQEGMVGGGPAGSLVPSLGEPTHEEGEQSKKGARVENSGGTFWAQIPILSLTEVLNPHF